MSLWSYTKLYREQENISLFDNMKFERSNISLEYFTPLNST